MQFIRVEISGEHWTAAPACGKQNPMNGWQTILGAGGAIGHHLARELRSFTRRIRLVGRHPQAVNHEDELFPADLTDAGATREAVAGSSVVYLTVGLPYNYRIWRRDWPRVMENTIQACREAGSRLVFFDNIYMYSGDLNLPITEEHPQDPPSRKGQVRKEILDRLWETVGRGDLEALVARAADFYGPHSEHSSVLGVTVFKPLASGKSAVWMGRTDKPHSFTYTPDAARATALLGNTPEAFGQTWHLPTAPEPWTGREWIETVAAAYRAKPNFQVAGKAGLYLFGLFKPVMREFPEMIYQYDRDYIFSSEKFESAFPLRPTSYEEGLSRWKSAF